MEVHPDLVVFSHLRWNFVWQRPQHLLSRLAADRRVFFIEEPVPGDRPSWELTEGAPNVTVCKPHSPVAAPGYHDDQLPVYRELLESLVADRQIIDPVVWFYTPMALPLLDDLRHSAVVYDCMDDL